MRPIVYPYNMGSHSATALAHALSTRKVYPDRKYRPHNNHVIINWGSGACPKWGGEAHWLNHWKYVEVAGNKLSTLNKLNDAGIPVPHFSTDLNYVRENLTDEYSAQWVARKVLRGHSGEGIELIMGGTQYGLGESVWPTAPLYTVWPTAPLYTKYIKKRNEYRVHVLWDRVIDVQEKRVREGSEGNNFQIRSHANGWVFCRDSITESATRDQLAVDAVRALGLDFGAVDIIYNSYIDTYFVLEVNTAPGLEGQTLDNYVEAFRSVL